MNIKKPLLVAGIASGVTLASLAGAGVVSAATGSTSTDGSNTLVQKIATKFGLKTSDVQAVFDQDRSDHEAARQAQVKKELDQLVTDGKITSEQEAKLIAKAQELQTQREANRDSMKDKSQAERKATMEAEKTALDKWFSDNGISTDYEKYVIGFGHGGRGHGFGSPDTDMPPSNSSTN